MKSFTNPTKDNPTINSLESLLPRSISEGQRIEAIQQIITAKTRLYVVTDEGISDMSLRDVANAFRGGMDADTIAICATESLAESELRERQRKKYADLVFTPVQPPNAMNGSSGATA